MQQPGTPADAAFVRLAQPDARTVEVRGREDLLPARQTPDGPAPERVLRWWESSGTLVTLVGIGVGEDELLRIAEGLRPATEAEVAALLEDRGAGEKDIAAGSGFDVATGNRSGQDWALTVSPRYCSSTPAVDDTELGLFVAFVDESVGEVTVVARDAGGNEVARDEVVVGPPAINPTTSGPA